MQFFIILSSCENWVTQISKILIQLNFSHQYYHFEVQHAYVMIKIKEVVSNRIFLSFVACSHYNFLWFLFSSVATVWCLCGFHPPMVTPWFPPSWSVHPPVVTPWFPPSHGVHPSVVTLWCPLSRGFHPPMVEFSMISVQFSSHCLMSLWFPPSRGDSMVSTFPWCPPFCGDSVVSTLPWFPPSHGGIFYDFCSVQ